jgi:3-hydroxyisobutyrate dehydrogenase
MTGPRGSRPFRLGFIGLGIMGVAITKRLLSRGWKVVCWNLEPERYELVREAGAEWVDSPAEVRANCDVVLICVLGDDAIQSICFGENGLASGKGAHIAIDLSTTNVELTHAMTGNLDMAWLDCPVSGGPDAAERGQLALMAGGTEDLFDWVRPILRDIGGNTTLMGPLGAGQTAKLINQAIVGVNYVLMGEILAQMKASGIDGEKLAKALAGGLADSVILQRILPQMLAGDYEPAKGRAKQLNKDLQALREFNEKLGLVLPVEDIAIDQYRFYAEQEGNGERDSASVARLYDPGEEPA